jgi:hypothetical protein
MADKKDPSNPVKLSVEEMEAALQKAQAELAQKTEQIAALQKDKDPFDFTGQPIAGTFTVSGEAPDGTVIDGTYQFKPGYVNCYLDNGHKVPSEALLTLANKGTIEEAVAAKHPELVTLGQAGAQDQLKNLIIIKKASFLVKVAAALMLFLFAFSNPLDAQVLSGFTKYFWKDTIKNQDTVFFLPGKQITDNAPMEAIWQFSYAGISGTPVLYIQIQEKAIDHVNAWVTVSTDTINASKKALFRRFDIKGIDQRVFVRSPSGTQQTRPLGYVKYFRKYQFP